MPNKKSKQRIRIPARIGSRRLGAAGLTACLRANCGVPGVACIAKHHAIHLGLLLRDDGNPHDLWIDPHHIRSSGVWMDHLCLGQCSHVVWTGYARRYAVPLLIRNRHVEGVS